MQTALLANRKCSVDLNAPCMIKCASESCSIHGHSIWQCRICHMQMQGRVLAHAACCPATAFQWAVKYRATSNVSFIIPWVILWNGCLSSLTGTFLANFWINIMCLSFYQLYCSINLDLWFLMYFNRVKILIYSG